MRLLVLLCFFSVPCYFFTLSTMATCCTLRKRANTKPKNVFHWIRKIDTYVQKTKGKTKHVKKQRQNNKHRQKQMGMLFSRHIYKPKICGSSVKLATLGDFSDNIFLRAAFGRSIEIPVTTSSSSPSTSTCTSASRAATFSDAPQRSTSKGKGRAKQTRRQKRM